MFKYTQIMASDIPNKTSPLNRCGYFVKRKKRNCRMLAKNGSEFCAEHVETSLTEASELVTDTSLRITCPLDPKHTCYAFKLKKHLKICNARQPEHAPSYLKTGINSGVQNTSEPHLPLSSYPTTEIIKLIEKIQKISSDQNYGHHIAEKNSNCDIVEEEMKNPEFGNKVKKHLKQTSAILGLISDNGMMKPDTCFIEFGAGRGQLSYWISKAVQDAKILLVERSSPKHKKDNKLDKSTVTVQRVRIDIAHLVLDELEIINQSKFIVGVTKHLCGVATDLAITCLSKVIENKSKLSGVVMTFCCHHQCLWSSYTGQKYFEEVGLTNEDFNVMCGMVSWATCGTGFSREMNQNADDGLLHVNEAETRLNLTREQKAHVGRLCKNTINWGRLKYLEELGFQCSLYYYVDTEVTPENVCIVAHK